MKIPCAKLNDAYLEEVIKKSQHLIRRMRWKAKFFEEEDQVATFIYIYINMSYFNAYTNTVDSYIYIYIYMHIYINQTLYMYIYI